MNPRTRFAPQNTPVRRWHDRTPLIAVFLVITGVIFVSRLFYLQVIKHEAYKAAATSEQLKKFSLPAERGKISVMDGDRELPVVLNETKYLIYADPSFITDPKGTAADLQPLIGGDTNELKEKLSLESRYVEIAKKVDTATAEKIGALKLKGIVLKEQRFRTYPEGQFAAQTLGFVNYDQEGQYGLEGYLNEQLAGTPGMLKAVTDIHGVPLAGNADNIVKQPQNGTDVTLTLDTTIQRIAEEAIKSGVERTQASGGSVVIIDVSSGAVKGMANWPTFSPSEYEKVTDQNLYKNKTVTDPLEIGSIMKTLTIASALDQGIIGRDSTYQDKGYEQVGEFKITNALNFGSGTFSIFDIIKNSLNTGAVHILKAMGGGELNEKARVIWHSYMTDHYQLGRATGIEQSNEADGVIPDPVEGDGLNIQYANTAFGQGMTATITQTAAALASILNGGTYYQPTLIHSTTNGEGETTVNLPRVVRTNVVSAQAGADLTSLMERYANENNREAARPGFSVGGKTGSAQIANPAGGYFEDRAIGTFAGFVGGQKPEYAIVLRVDEPKSGGFAGSGAARPVFTEIANNMMNSLPFTPKQ